MKVKICGITNSEDAAYCESLGADALGFIFYNRSKRYVQPEVAAEIIKHLSPFTIKVGVFVNETSDSINNISTLLHLNAAQIHDEENVIDRKSIIVPVIRSFRVKDNFDFSILNNLDNNYFILDSYSQNEFGGTGKSFNWELIPESIKKKTILAGGISSTNIDYICRKIRPAAVDLSSSLEAQPGTKDKEKVKEFFYKFNKYRSN